VVTSDTTATSSSSGTNGSSSSSRNSPEIEPGINPEETPPTAESQLSNNQHEENEKYSRAETEEGEKQKTRREEKEDTDTSTEPASTRLFLDFFENQTDERSPEKPVGLPDVDDAIISQASLPPEGHFWTELSEGVERLRAADANARVDEIASYATSLQQLQEPMAEPHGLPNPDNALIEEQARFANIISSPREPEADHTCVCVCNRRRRRMEEPEEAARVRKGEKKSKMS